MPPSYSNMVTGQGRPQQSPQRPHQRRPQPSRPPPSRRPHQRPPPQQRPQHLHQRKPKTPPLKMPPPKPIAVKPLGNASVLRDSFVPQHLKAIHLSQVRERWVIADQDGRGFNNNAADAEHHNMEPVISTLARNFIPKVPCVCPPGATTNGDKSKQLQMHGPQDYLSCPPHVVPPDTHFALMQQNGKKRNWSFIEADLDETTSLDEYCLTFRSAIRAEHEELMMQYEKYSLFGQRVEQLESPNQAKLCVEGIVDARPALQVSDLVLLRPVQPLEYVTQGYRGIWQTSTYTIEIETRVLAIIRGKNYQPDQIIIGWDLNRQQKDALKDPEFVREYAVRFIPSSVIIDRSLTALDWLGGLAVNPQYDEALKSILFPVNAPVVKALTAEQRRIPACEPPLNDLQLSFVRMVRARTYDPSCEMTRPPMILTGPAGTGKTKTFVYSIADVLGILDQGNVLEPQAKKANTNRVLVCCPSNAATDVLTRRLSKLLKRSEIFRMFDASRPISTVPSDILPFTCQSPGSGRFTLPPPSVWLNLRVVLCTCLDAHLLFKAQIKNEVIRKKQECFKTFLLSGTSPLGLDVGGVTANEDPFFSHLFIDEAAQATEPELLIPISCVVDPNPGWRKVEVVLSGDPRQLSPRVYAGNVVDSLGRSLMERLLRRPVTCMGGGNESLLGPESQPDSIIDTGSLSDLIRYYASVDGQEQLTVFLTENYRGHPCFLMMPSSFFYFDRLRSAKIPDVAANEFWCEKLRMVEALSEPVKVSIAPNENAWGTSTEVLFSQIQRQTTWPIHFRGVKGADSSVALAKFSGTDSWQNVLEADIVVDIVITLIQDGVAPQRIGVISPFRGQVNLIRKLLREKFLHNVNVGTVENYQAVEQDVIVLSLTRASQEFVDYDVKKRMGLYGQPKQANVAMTRAENLFIVVGDPTAMWRDAAWRQWLRFCFRNGLWYGEGLMHWKKVESISLKDMKYVSALDLSKNHDEGGMNQVVVSTLEKIHRQSSPTSLSMLLNAKKPPGF